MRIRVALAAVLALAAVPPSAPAAFRQFAMPSRNIFCGGDSTSLRCDIGVHTWRAPKRPSSCEFDWGSYIGMSRRGRVTFECVSDSMANTHVLKYGRTWRNGSFRCTSRTTALTCRNAAGHGFKVSRARLARF
jgi:hypothetical protein